MTWRLALFAGLAFVAGGCSVGHVYERYRNTLPVVVNIGCGSALYEVFENPRERAVMVRTNALASVGPLLCSSDSTGRMSAEERIRRAAELYFENTNRPQCKIEGGRALTVMHSEFAYSCGR